jgi:cell wall-associated NlpC family hydrolase
MEQAADIRRAIVADARTWIGTPWQHQGRIKGLGVDCIGFVVGAAQASGLVTADQLASLPANYGRFPHANLFLRTLREHMITVPGPGVSNALIGDFVLVCVANFPWHIGILTDYNGHGGLGEPFGLIHAVISINSVTEQRFDPSHIKVHSVYRLPGLE